MLTKRTLCLSAIFLQPKNSLPYFRLCYGSQCQVLFFFFLGKIPISRYLAECVRACIVLLGLLWHSGFGLRKDFSSQASFMSSFSFSHSKGSSLHKKSKKKKKHKHKDRDVCGSSNCTCTCGPHRNDISMSHSCSLFTEKRL